jgi:hypothetical protein
VRARHDPGDISGQQLLAVRRNDRAKRLHSGEGYSIRYETYGFVVETGDGVELFPMRSLAKAKAWCAAQIRRERLSRIFQAG